MPLTSLPRLRGLIRPGEASHPVVPPVPDRLWPSKSNHGNNMGRGGGGGRGKKKGGEANPLTAPHRAYRFFSEDSQGSTVMALYNMEIYADLDGVDYTSPAEAAAKAISSLANVSFPAENAFDDTTSLFHTITDINAWLGWDNGADENDWQPCAGVALAVRASNNHTQSPGDLLFQYTDDDPLDTPVWSDLWDLGSVVRWQGSEARTFWNPAFTTGDANDVANYTLIEGYDPGSPTMENVAGGILLKLDNSADVGGKILMQPTNQLICPDLGVHGQREVGVHSLGACFKIVDHANFDNTDYHHAGIAHTDETNLLMHGVGVDGVNGERLFGIGHAAGFSTSTSGGWSYSNDVQAVGLYPTKVVPKYIGVIMYSNGTAIMFVGDSGTQEWTEVSNAGSQAFPDGSKFGFYLGTFTDDTPLEMTVECHWNWYGDWPFL